MIAPAAPPSVPGRHDARTIVAAGAGRPPPAAEAGDTVAAIPLSETLPVALIQGPPVFLDLEASVERAVDYVEQASRAGAWLTVFPETWLPGYPVWLDYAPGAGLWDHPPARALHAHMVRQCPEVPGTEISRLHEAARRFGTHVVIGVQERDGATLYNTVVYLDADGRGRRIHRKLVPTYTERLVWGRGDGSTLGVMSTPQANVGALICWEHWMPLARAAMHAQREHVHVAQWPGVKELHQLASRHYAFEGQCFVLACGTAMTRGEMLAGFDGSRGDGEGNDRALARSLLTAVPGADGTHLLGGGSAVIGPDAQYVLPPAAPDARLLLADLPLQAVVEGWLAMDSDGHYSRPDVFELTVNCRELRNVRFETPTPAAERQRPAPMPPRRPHPDPDDPPAP